MYGDLHSAIIKSLTLGVCNNQGTYPVASESPAYNLNNLLTNEQHLADNFNPVKKMTNWIEENTVWFCLANLIVMGFKFIIFWASVTVTMLQKE